MALRDLLTLTEATDALATFKEQIGHSRLLSNLIVRSVYCRTAGKPSEIDQTEWLETELSVLPLLCNCGHAQLLIHACGHTCLVSGYMLISHCVNPCNCS